MSIETFSTNEDVHMGVFFYRTTMLLNMYKPYCHQLSPDLVPNYQQSNIWVGMHWIQDFWIWPDPDPDRI